jgi:hypothetical protein
VNNKINITIRSNLSLYIRTTIRKNFLHLLLFLILNTILVSFIILFFSLSTYNSSQALLNTIKETNSNNQIIHSYRLNKTEGVVTNFSDFFKEDDKEEDFNNLILDAQGNSSVFKYYNFNYSFKQLKGVNTNNIITDNAFVSYHLNKLIALDNQKLNVKLRYGLNLQKENDIIISDFTAHGIIRNKLYPNINEEKELIGKELNFTNDIKLRICGIVETQYMNYSYLDGESLFSDIYEFERTFFPTKNISFVRKAK